MRNVVLFLFMALLIVALGACGTGTREEVSGLDQKAYSTFGEETDQNGAISYDGLLHELESRDSISAKVSGKVSGVCQAKGCWLTLVPEIAEGPEMMVKFRDYGFFVPKDIAGRQVVLKGTAYRAITPVDELRHLARDAGKSETEVNAITEPEETLQFIADGVLLMPAAQDQGPENS